MTPPSASPGLSTEVLSSALQPWADVSEGIQRRLLHFADHEEGWEILWVGPGAARAASWWVGRSGSPAAAVDPNPDAVTWAEGAVRRAGAATLLTLQVGRLDDLPHTEAVYDLVVASLLFDPDADLPRAVAEAVRVVRPLRPVLCAVPVWTGTPVGGVSETLATIGVTPRFLTEWKQVLRDAGLVEVTAESVTGDHRWLVDGTIGPLARAWQGAGLDGARTILSAPVRTLRRLVHRRAIDLAMVRGVRWEG